MSANQDNATTFNPNGLDLVCVAEYARTIDAGIDRVWENVLDWEHLPCLHSTSFDYVELDQGGQWGWRTWSDPAQRDHIELTVADDTSYVARSYRAGKQISEIWTWLTPVEAPGLATTIRVEFHLPGVAPAQVQHLGKAMLGLYERLWDEDEAMMKARQQRLDETRNPARQASLGWQADVRARLPLTFQLGRGEFVVREVGGELVVYSAICPHLLGPLGTAGIEEGVVTCPWHGYQFDVVTGDCIAPSRATCRLPRPPRLVIESGAVIARL